MSDTRDTAGQVRETHTPGPWMQRLESTRFVIQHEGEIGLRAIAITAGSYPLSEPNARLIAAAPCLLAALEDADRCFTQFGPDPEAVEAFSEADKPIADTWRRIRAAIARARGGENG